MSNKYYNVYSADTSSLPKYPLDEGESETAGAFAIIGMIALVVTIVWAIVNLFSGGYGWLVCLCIYIISAVIYRLLQNEANSNLKVEKVNSQAVFYSNQLNEILNKSDEIVKNILPYFETSAKKSIDIAKTDLSDNAISPFGDRIEEASRSLALYKEAIDQLQLNGEVYSKILDGKNHNFPRRFPIGTNISISETLLDEYNTTIRKAHTKPEFGNIWEQRKTQKILIAGFQSLGQAINNMKDEIVSSIESLEYSIKSEFRDLKNIQLEQLRTFETSQTVLNNTLTSMDKKLYYIQYKEKPIRPFIRPPSDI